MTQTPTLSNPAFLSDATFRPEETLLILCARTRLDESSAAHVNALLREDLDWDYLLRMAFQHSIVPLLYKTLLPDHETLLPKPFADELRAYFHGNALRNMVLTRELLALVDGLEALNIPSLPFKGPALAVTAYGDLSLRQFGDLDLLVQKEHLEKAEVFFYGRGYRSREHHGNALLKRARVFLRGYHLKLEKGDGQVILEPHWHVEGRHLGFRFDVETLWGRLQSVSLGGREVRAISARRPAPHPLRSRLEAPVAALVLDGRRGRARAPNRNSTGTGFWRKPKRREAAGCSFWASCSRKACSARRSRRT